jgi:O-antigen/teichoic acid export membrane protein
LPILASALSGEWALLAIDEFVFVSLRQFFFLLCSALGIVIFVDKPDDLNLYAALLILPQVAAVVLNLPKIWPHLKLTEISMTRITADVRGASIFLASTIATTMYTNLDSIALALFRTTNEVGEYALAKRIILAAISGSTALSAITLSRASNYHSQQSTTGFNRLILFSIRFLLLVALPSVAIMVLLRHEIIGFFGGAEYYRSLPVLAILSPNILFVGVGFVALVQILIPRGQEKQALICWALGGSVGLISVAVLVPRFGTIGAAIANLIAEGVVVGMAVWFTRKDLAPNIRSVEIMIALASLSMMLVVTTYAKQNLMTASPGTSFLELASLVSIAAIAYLGTVLVGIIAINRNGIKSKISTK